MAKRKRLTPAQPDYFNTTGRAPENKPMSGPDFSAPPTPSPAPIAQVAGESATRAALDEVTGVLQDARQQGRLIESLALESVNAGYLVRDRMLQDDDDMDALMTSLRARGQQTPIEVTALSDVGSGPAYGLISGWRRLNALQRLYRETSEARFATIKALVVTPENARDAYLAMVEENEIRANLSLYERARISLRAAREGVFPTPRHAVLGLFGATPRAKRSKIGRFVVLVEALGGVLMHPTAITEKLGLDLARALDRDPELARKITDRLTVENPQTVAEEQRILSQEARPAPRRSATPGAPTPPPPAPALSAQSPRQPGEVVPGVRLLFEHGHRPPRIELSGAGVNKALVRALKDWLAETQTGPQK
ncbi:MAG: chromosome partitioning protein ParB [Rhodobacteraceae bacterium]|nr:MAG: chromosome partitioning protein ParB [Paracoccaceae bacterium]